MSMNDLVSDLITRIRNGQRANLSKVACPSSKLSEGILKVLMEEGYIRAYAPKEVRKGVNEIEVELKYYEGEPVIREITRVSKPGRRVYSAIGKLQRHSNGLGISIISTSKGVLSDHDARQHNVGGEVLCTVF